MAQELEAGSRRRILDAGKQLTSRSGAPFASGKTCLISAIKSCWRLSNETTRLSSSGSVLVLPIQRRIRAPRTERTVQGEKGTHHDPLRQTPTRPVRHDCTPARTLPNTQTSFPPIRPRDDRPRRTRDYVFPLSVRGLKRLSSGCSMRGR